MDWFLAAHGIHGAEVTITCRFRAGSPRKFETSIRAMADHHGAIRLDRRCPILRIWEAIDGGEGFASLAEAQAYAARWVRAANHQGTLQPRMTRQARTARALPTKATTGRRTA